VKIYTSEIIRSIVGNNFVGRENKKDYLVKLKKSFIKLKKKFLEEFPELSNSYEFEQLYLPYNYIFSFFQQKDFWTAKEIKMALPQLEKTCKIWLIEHTLAIIKAIK
jgi:hypothetical protein